MTQFAVDPTANCCDGGSASTGGFRIETSADGATWTTAGQGTFTADDLGRLNSLAADRGRDRGAVRAVHDPGQPGAGLRHRLPDGAVHGLSVRRPDRAGGVRHPGALDG